MFKGLFNLNQIRSGIIVPIFVLLIGILAWFVLWPKYQGLRESGQNLSVKEGAVLARESQLSDVKKLISEFQSKKSGLEQIDEAVPPAPRIPELLVSLENLSKQSGLLISSLQFSIVPNLSKAEPGQDVSKLKQFEGKAEDLSILKIDAVFKGKYPSLKNFLLNLEQNLRLMDIQSLTLGQVEKESGTQEYALKIQTYYQKE